MSTPHERSPAEPNDVFAVSSQHSTITLHAGDISMNAKNWPSNFASWLLEGIQRLDWNFRSKCNVKDPAEQCLHRRKKVLTIRSQLYEQVI